ncbi:MAG: glucoamylase family protein [Gemmatimonadota bacterium]
MSDERTAGPGSALARALATPIREAPPRSLSRRFRRRLRAVRDDVVAAVRRADAQQDSLGASRAEWLVGNRHVIVRAADQALEDVPAGFHAVLPRLSDDSTLPRIERLAGELVERNDGFVDEQAVVGFVRDFQSVTALDTGELWAIAPFLRLLLLERLLSLTSQAEEEGSDGQAVGACITSLRAIDHADWLAIVESLSLVERCFRRLDPSRSYADMDRRTRDRYRSAVEELSRWSDTLEVGVAMECVSMAGGDAPDHVGALLIGDRRPEFEAALGARLPLRARARRLLFRHAGRAYFGLVGALSLAAAALPLRPLLADDVGWGWLVLAALLVASPAISVAVAIANTVLTRLVPPRALAKMDFSLGIPGSWRTCVAVPAIVQDPADIEVIVKQVERNYRGNADENLVCAILLDPPDADTEEAPGDAAIIASAESAIQRLNDRYGSEGHTPFLLLARPRLWNPGEGRWMAWERKRGKLHELNRLILGDQGVDLRFRIGDVGALDGVRFVLTLDADTFLPRGVASRLASALAHPLNRPRFDEEDRLVDGYTVLQPRVETLVEGDEETWFTRIFQADEGLDLYSHAASDIYQDLFGEGVYVGKGLYDVAAFERSLTGRVPENSLLSHDLFEGVHGRTALVSDTSVIEDYPSTPTAWMRRLHRWGRGDWQLLPWLLPWVPSASGSRIPNRLSALARWMMFDNLRRSLASPSLLLLAVFGWLALPGGAGWWTAWIVAFPGVPVLLAAVSAAPARVRQWPSGAPFRRSLRPALHTVGRWAAAVVFLPWQALTELDAALRTLFRLMVSQRGLLEWTSAAQTTRSLAGESRVGVRLGPMIPALTVSAALGTTLWLFPPLQTVPPTLLLLAWLASPFTAWALARPRRRRRDDVTAEQRLWLRRLARRTWAYFERLMSPVDHWLPPDNLQIEPDRGIAHRTSPTNIGLGILSVATAHELGHTTLSRAVATLTNTFETLERLERHRGHFLNWYDTRNLHPLAPRYVSSVDSGNLAACLVATGESLRDFERTPFPRSADVHGLADTLEVTAEVTRAAGAPAESSEPLWRVARRLRAMETNPERLPVVLEHVFQEVLKPIEAITAMVGEGAPGWEGGQSETSEIRGWVGAVHRQLTHLQQEFQTLLPWRAHLVFPPAVVREAPPGPIGDAWTALRATVPTRTSLADAATTSERVRGSLETLRHVLEAADDLTGQARDEALSWIRNVDRDLDIADDRARALRAQIVELRSTARRFVADMDFRFLYDTSRRLLHIGYNVDAAGLDRSYYDLYASEARLASYIGMAKGDLPVQHWLELGRPFGRRSGSTLLLSWAGTMFEYLMPALFLRVPEGSLADEAGRRAVDAQMAYGKRHGVPWGVSESGYADLDPSGDYRYRAFGIPNLALRHDPGDDPLVVTPYASALALVQRPASAIRNLQHLADIGLLSSTGFYEAVDFGSRAFGPARPRIVRSAMAHHQGMILGGIHHVLTDGAMSERFHRDSAAGALAYLLHEESPGVVRTSAAPPPAPRTTLPPRPAPAPPWTVDAESFPPPAMVLSNGSLSTLLTARGAGGLRWKGRDVLRWRPDPTIQGWGMWVYVRDVRTDRVWSVGQAPSWTPCDRYEAIFSGEAVEFHRDDGPLKMRTTIVVSPSADVEIRRVTLVNEGDSSVSLALTSLGEVALATPAEDRRHPAFARLFVEAEFDRPSETLLFRRRAEGLDEQGLCMAHTVVASSGELSRWEVDRGRFLDRGGDLRRPPGVVDPGPAGTERAVWAPLDPVASLTWKIDVPAGGEASVAFLTAVGGTKQAVEGTIRAHRSLGTVQWAIDRARERSREVQLHLGIEPDELPAFQRLLTALVFPFHRSRMHSAVPPAWAGEGTRQALWSIGVSGDVPVLTLRASGDGDSTLLTSLLRAHAFWERHGVRYDLVVIGDGTGDTYAEPLGGRLRDLLAQAGRGEFLNRPAGIHYVPAGRIPPAETRRVEEAASLALHEGQGSLSAALADLERRPDPLPSFVAVPSEPIESFPSTPLEPDQSLDFFNGFGGFRREDTAYVIRVEAGNLPPAPWINVVANERFGFLVSEAGLGATWDGNSGERRLSPWSNDPVLDPAGEALYLRDEETAEIWSTTPGPAGGNAACHVTHRPGSTSFLKHSHGLEQLVEVFVPGRERAKVVEVRLRNLWPRQRRITLTYFAEWVLGSARSVTAPHIVTSFDRRADAIVAEDHLQAAPVGFLASDAPVHGFTCDRTEFLGPEGDRATPAGLKRIGLSGATGAGLDPCGALQVHVDLAPGGDRVVRFFLGALEGPDEASDRLASLRDPTALDSQRTETATFWDDVLHRTTVRTPEPSMDLLLNGWLRYQALVCRLWGRSGFYQSSGAFGFRDQLQDGLGLLSVAPEVCRARILDAASRQFLEGDVLHWWHSESGQGVRTRCSDDLYWLPYVTAAYVGTTGDEGVLDELVPFLEGAPLEPDEMERYATFETAEPPATLHEHCLRALQRTGVTSSRGVPLIGSGDWNDGLNRVGVEGRGESFWLGWFLARVSLDYARVCERRGEDGQARRLRARADRLRKATEAHAWDGAWYRRATYDDGVPMGSAQSREGSIDSLPQSWSVLSGVGDAERSRVAMQSVWDELVDPESRLVLLLKPPFHDTPRHPGYIKSYPPGVRENGGQYTHAATWVGWALAEMGDGDRAEAVFRILNPILRSTTPEEAERYRVEPYAVAGDVYAGPHHAGRGGWTWYTGSASWLYRLGAEAILGLHFVPEGLRIDPCIPSRWKRFVVRHRHGDATYHILVRNPSSVTEGVRSVTLDGKTLEGPIVPFEDDGQHHHVVVTLGPSGVGEAQGT